MHPKSNFKKLKICCSCWSAWHFLPHSATFFYLLRQSSTSSILTATLAEVSKTLKGWLQMSDQNSTPFFYICHMYGYILKERQDFACVVVDIILILWLSALVTETLSSIQSYLTFLRCIEVKESYCQRSNKLIVSEEIKARYSI